MTKPQKIILGFAVLSYVGILASFLAQMHTLMLVFVIASAVLLISFNLAGGAELDNLEAEKNEQIEKISEQLRVSKLNVDEVNQKLADKDNALSETMKLYKNAQSEAKEAQKELENAKEEAKTIKEEAEEKKKRAVEEAVTEALAKAKLSVDDRSFAGMDALIPNISEDEIVEEMNLVEIAKSTADEFAEYAKNALVTIKVHSTEDNLKFFGDPERIRIMLRNIIDNSIKYMNREGSLVITLSLVGDEVFIVLKDNGEGLSKEETTHIFDLNFQGSNRISGNGLGLTQAKAIADKYAGNIYARSSIGNGMGIYIQLPVSRNGGGDSK